MGYLAVVGFVALLAFGRTYFGWDDASGNIQIALVSAFVFGLVSGYRAKT